MKGHTHIFALALLVLTLAILYTRTGEASSGTSTSSLTVMPITQELQPQSSSDCNDLDVVILVDQSFSMNFNDRDNKRAEAIRFAISTVGENVIYFCPRAQHRLAVVGFWDINNQETVATEVYFKETLAPTASDFGGWEVLRDSLQSRVNVQPRGSTDYIAGFEQAESIFIEWRNAPLGELPRRQTLIVIADGGPCVVTEGCNPQNPEQSTFNPATYMLRLSEFSAASGNAFPWSSDGQGISIWLVAFNDGQGGEYDYLADADILGSWRQITQSHGGDVLILQRGDSDSSFNADIAVKLSDILDRELGSEFIENQCGQPIQIPPYQDSLILNVFKIGSNPNVAIDDVAISITYQGSAQPVVFRDGREYRADVLIDENADLITSYQRNGPIEQYTFSQPTPGSWLVSASNADICKHVDVKYKPVSIKYKVLTPGLNQVVPQIPEAPYYDEEAPLRFVYSIEETDRSSGLNVPITELPGYPLQVELSLLDPAGNRIPTPCVLVRQESRYQCMSPLSTEVAGEYNWEVIASAPSVSASGEQFELFKDVGRFTVGVVDRFDFELIEPTSGQEYPVNQIVNGQSVGQSIPLAIRLIDDGGNLLDAGALIAAPDQPIFTVNMSGPNDFQESEQVYLTDYDAVEGRYEVNLRDSLGAAPDSPGAYQLQVSLSDNFLFSRYYPRSRTQEITITRPGTVALDYRIAESNAANTDIRQPLYRGSFACVGATVVPVDTAVVLFDMDQPDVLIDPNVLSPRNPEDLFLAELISPSDRRTPMQVMIEQSGREGARLRITGGESVTEAGEYLLRVTPNISSLYARYQLVRTESLELRVTRDSSFLSSPTTCRGIGAVLGLLAAVGLTYSGWLLTGGPVGQLMLTNGSEVLVGPIRLRKTPRRNKKRSSQLRDWGIKELYVEHAEPTDPEARSAVRVIAIDNDNTEFFDGTLNPGDVVPFVDGADIQYDDGSSQL